MAAARAGTLLRYFKGGRENEEHADRGDSHSTRVKKAKKDRGFTPAWKKDFVWLVYNETEGKNVLSALCKFSKNGNSFFCKGSNKYFLIAIETQDKRHIILFIRVYYYNLKSDSCITIVFNV